MLWQMKSGLCGKIFFSPFSQTVKYKWKLRMWEALENLVERPSFLPCLSTTSLNSLLPAPPHSNLLGSDFVGLGAAAQVWVVPAWPLMGL